MTQISYEFSAAHELDMVYGLLHLNIRKKVERDEVTKFDQLITRARNAEQMAQEQAESNTPTKTNEAPPAAQDESSTESTQDTKPQKGKSEVWLSKRVIAANSN